MLQDSGMEIERGALRGERVGKEGDDEEGEKKEKSNKTQISRLVHSVPIPWVELKQSVSLKLCWKDAKGRRKMGMDIKKPRHDLQRTPVDCTVNGVLLARACSLARLCELLRSCQLGGEILAFGKVQ